MLNQHRAASPPVEPPARKERRASLVAPAVPTGSDSSLGSDTVRGSKEPSPAETASTEVEAPPAKIAVIPPTPTERTPLLGATSSAADESRSSWRRRVEAFFRPKAWSSPSEVVKGVTWSGARQASLAPVQYIPATILGVLMNVLDGASTAP
jgi:hypothetical protein